LWAFMLMTGSRKEYLLSLEDLSNIRHTGEHLSNVIEEVINKVGAKKFVAIVSDNGSNVAAARKIIANNYPNIINVRCIAHCVNLISMSIVKIDEVKYIVRCVNILTKYFKNSTLGSSWLNEAIKSKNIDTGRNKNFRSCDKSADLSHISARFRKLLKIGQISTYMIYGQFIELFNQTLRI